MMGKLRRLLPSLFARVAGAGFTIGLTIFLARSYGAEYSGRFYYLISTVSVLGLLTRLGAEQYMTAHVTPIVRQWGIVRSGGQFLSTLAAVGGLILLAGALLAATQLVAPALVDRLLGDLPHLHELVLAVLGFNAIWTVSGYARAAGWASTSIFLETAVLSLWMIGIILLTTPALHAPQLSNIALGMFWISPLLLVPLLAFFWKHRQCAIRPRDVATALSGIVRFASVTITNSLIVWIPLLTLGFMGKTEELGIYNGAFRVTMLVGAFAVMIKSALIKEAVLADQSLQHGHAQRLEDIRKSLKVALPFIAISVVLSWQRELLASVFGAGFERLESIITVMLLAQSVNVAGYLIETRAVLARDTRLLNLNSLVTVITSLASAPLLIAYYGLQGAAWSFALTVVVSRLHMAALYLRGREASWRAP